MMKTKPTSGNSFSKDDYAYMKAALELAKRGLGQVAPNPSVGCVIVKNGHIIGRGWTGTGGRPHGETVALSNAENAEGSTVYVTLEPCAHQGATPSCANSLVDAKVSKVIIATGDPDPRVNGKGIQILRDSGVDVEFGLLKEEADRINRGFFNRIEKKTPLVTVKIASSLDGKIAKSEGEKIWITGIDARMRGHLYRASHDAIMVGIGTVVADDPMLDCRVPGLEGNSPIRVVLDTHLKIPIDSKLCKSANESKLIIITSSNQNEKIAQLKGLGAKVIQIDNDAEGMLDIGQALECLADEGITRVLAEGGAKLNASLIKASLVDRLIWFKSNDSVGENGVNALYDIAINELDRYLNLTPLDQGKSGSDHWQEFDILG